MRIDIYSKRGDMSTVRGMVLNVETYNDLYFGKPDIYGEEITKDEYNNLMNVVKNFGSKRGFEGYVNDEGYAKYLEYLNKSGE